MTTEFKNSKLKGNNKRYAGRYINRFMGMKAASDLLIRGLFPNAKEITESFAAVEACRHLPVEWNEDITVVCVGDGHAPRTAASFAFMSKWECHSVDPKMRDKEWNIERLTTHRFKIEDCWLSFNKPCVIVCVHSHARIENTLPYIKAPVRHLITMECCVPLGIKGVEPDVDYEDDDVWSPKNRIKIWKNV